MSGLHANEDENRRRCSTAKATTLLIGSFCIISVHPFYLRNSGYRLPNDSPYARMAFVIKARMSTTQEISADRGAE